MSAVAIYSALPIEMATAAREAAARIKVRMSRTASDIVEIGRDLIQIKGDIGHGNFLPWIEAEFAMSDQTAANFMNVAKKFGSQIPNGLEFSPTVLYALAAPSTPEPVREEIMRRAEAGEKVAVSDVNDLKQKLKDAEETIRTGRQDLKMQKHVAQLAKNERDELLNRLQFAESRIREQADEVEKLKQPGVIHVFPEPTFKPSMLRTAAELIAERFDWDADEVAAVLREAGVLSLAAEIEAVVKDRFVATRMYAGEGQ